MLLSITPTPISACDTTSPLTMVDSVTTVIHYAYNASMICITAFTISSIITAPKCSPLSQGIHYYHHRRRRHHQTPVLPLSVNNPGLVARCLRIDWLFSILTDLLKRDLVGGLMLMDFLPRLRYILEVIRPQQKVCSQIFGT